MRVSKRPDHVAGGHSLEAQVLVVVEAEAFVVGRVAQNNAAARSRGSEPPQTLFHERLADTLALQPGPHRDGPEAGPTYAAAVHRDAREGNMPVHDAVQRRHEGDVERPGAAKLLDDGPFRAAAVWGILEGGVYYLSYVCFVARLLLSNEDVHGVGRSWYRPTKLRRLVMRASSCAPLDNTQRGESCGGCDAAPWENAFASTRRLVGSQARLPRFCS